MRPSVVSLFCRPIRRLESSERCVPGLNAGPTDLRLRQQGSECVITDVRRARSDSVASVGLVATGNVENVKGLAQMIHPKANPPFPDPKSVFRRINPSEAPHIARSFDGEAIERPEHTVSNIWIKPAEIVRGFVAPADQPIYARRSFRLTSSCESVFP